MSKLLEKVLCWDLEPTTSTDPYIPSRSLLDAAAYVKGGGFADPQRVFADVLYKTADTLGTSLNDLERGELRQFIAPLAAAPDEPDLDIRRAFIGLNLLLFHLGEWLRLGESTEHALSIETIIPIDINSFNQLSKLGSVIEASRLWEPEAAYLDLINRFSSRSGLNVLQSSVEPLLQENPLRAVQSRALGLAIEKHGQDILTENLAAKQMVATVRAFERMLYL